MADWAGWVGLLDLVAPAVCVMLRQQRGLDAANVCVAALLMCVRVCCRRCCCPTAPAPSHRWLPFNLVPPGCILPRLWQTSLRTRYWVA